MQQGLPIRVPEAELAALCARYHVAFFRLEWELAELFGRRVDLNTKASLSPYFRDRVLFEARDLYVAA